MMDFQRVFRTFCLAGGLFWAVSVSAQSPTLTHALSAAAPGRMTEITFIGDNLKEPSALWASFKQTAKWVPGTDVRRSTWKLEAPADTAVGIHQVRLMGGNGVSNPLLVMVDDLPSALANGTNRSTATAQVLTLPVAVDGACEQGKSDYYRFRVVKNQRLTVEVVAQRLNSALDPLIRLYDAGGRELAFNEDAPGLGEDARLTYRFATAGECVLAIRDTKFEGGAGHRYHLRLGDFPLLNTTFPLAVRTGDQTTVQLAGLDSAGLKPVTLTAPKETGTIPLSATLPKGVGSGFAALEISAAAEMVEQEPNDTAATAQKVALPLAMNGRFQTGTDRDWYAFEAKKGQRVIFTVKTRSYDSPSEAYLRLCKADGSSIAEANVTGAEETTLTNTFNAEGTFKVVVEELTRRGGPEHTYHLEIMPREPGFELSVESERLQVTTNGTVELKVTAVRRDFDGPITITAAGLPEGFIKLENNVIAEKKTETTLKLTVHSGFLPGSAHLFRLNGSGKTGEKEQTTPVSTLPALRKVFSNLRFPPMGQEGVIALGIKATN